MNERDQKMSIAIDRFNSFYRIWLETIKPVKDFPNPILEYEQRNRAKKNMEDAFFNMVQVCMGQDNS